MDDLTGTSTERLRQLRAGDTSGRDAAWFERQLVSALEGWQDAEDQLAQVREGREDY